MLRLSILILLGYLAYQLVKKWFRQHLMSGPTSRREQLDDVMVKDPHCQVYFPRRDGVHLRHDGRDLFFCSKECRDRFLDGPSDDDPSDMKDRKR